MVDKSWVAYGEINVWRKKKITYLVLEKLFKKSLRKYKTRSRRWPIIFPI